MNRRRHSSRLQHQAAIDRKIATSSKCQQSFVFSALTAAILLGTIPSSESFATLSPCRARLCTLPRSTSSSLSLLAKKGVDDDEYYEDGELYDDDDDDEYFEEEYEPRRRRRKQNYDDLGGANTQYRKGLGVPSSYGRRDGWRLPESVSKALLAGVFVMGVGLGVTVDSAINTSPRDLASRDAIDQAAPNAELCATMGASAMAFDQRVFVSFNPFNVYVAQADVKPACVLRQANIVPILRDKNLINDAEVRSCKANMNTWAFVGDLSDSPQLSCVYKSEDAQNEFLSDPKFGIGEDYLDDDRAKAGGLKKNIKMEMTEGQRQEAIRKHAARVPGLD